MLAKYCKRVQYKMNQGTNFMILIACCKTREEEEID